jgi:hypothetical protein
MTTQGLWTLELQTSKAWTNGGVIVLKGNKVFGGDSQYYYTGSFQEQGDDVTGEITATHYHGAVSTAFGTNERSYRLSMSGKHNGDAVNGHIWRPEAPTKKLNARMTRQESFD